jgi:gliding motility-associated-like protein
VNLTAQSPTSVTINPVICLGQTYTLPWGAVVNTAGIYKDTLRYTATNCDSIYRTVNLFVQSPQSTTINPVICAGQTYTLPWGQIVSTAGTYRDTLHYINTGCDSLRRAVNLNIQTAQAAAPVNVVICSGQTYILPWGQTVNVAGTYKDTLRYSVTSCDSIYRTVNLSVQSAQSTIINPVICSGQNYILPWGQVVSAAGTYRDTLHYANTGCDSIRRTVNLFVQSPQSTTINPVICSGQTYTLPWGQMVSAAGTYRDTLHYINTGCDSLRRTVNLSVQTAQTAAPINAVICAGQTYTLPWGSVVSAAGVYRDTLRYTNISCDSLRRTVNLTVQTSTSSSNNVTICEGQTYTLPWGRVVNTSGIYRDTLRYRITNCDSLIRIINLTVTGATVSNSSASICSGDTYTLPWGGVVSTAGIYRDTVRTVQGCISQISSVNLTVNPKPTVSLSKSNDIDCMIGISKLNASGGSKYLWSPANTLSNPNVSNPVATPTATTIYQVQVTSSNGCINTGSIQVSVKTSATDSGFLMPNAFTPNGDGLNDCFGVKHWGQVSNLKLEVFNRWGQLVFSTTDPNHCWDGTFKGVQQASAVFIYQVSAETICGRVFRKGTVILIR